MGTVYARGDRLWIGYKDPSGKWVYAGTDFKVGQEDQARKLLKVVERRIEAGQEYGEAQHGPVTLERYFERWIEQRKKRLASGRDDETRVRLHALPTLGKLVLNEIRPRHVRQLVNELKAKMGSGKDQLAARSVRNIYGVLHRLFEDAVADELIEVNPCALKRGELPKKVDKDPTWRARAVYSREEVEQLISDARIPEKRRVIYAGIFLTGCRIGEWAARHWKDWEPELAPLGRMLMASSFDRREKEEKSVKNERPREVPVHPTLARVLAAWKTEGWRRTFGRDPTPEDLISPSPAGGYDIESAWHDLQDDLAALGLRRRRVHDSRRTFISLAQADGARKDILRWVTHGPDGDIVDLYTTLPWHTLCEEVAKLQIHLPQGARGPQAPRRAAPELRQRPEAWAVQAAPEAAEGQVIPFHRPTSEQAKEAAPRGNDGTLTTALLQPLGENEKAPKSRGLGGSPGSVPDGIRKRGLAVA